MDTKKERTADEGAYWRSAFGVRRVGVSAIRGALPRLRGRWGWRRVGGLASRRD
jgi:hypothetical protein